MNDDNANDNDNDAVSCMECRLFILKTFMAITTESEWDLQARTHASIPRK
jgi:hypothetical protein